jgi:nicotinamidase-related amidase
MNAAKKAVLLTVDLQLTLVPGACPAPVREALLRRLAAARAAGLPIVHALGGRGVLRARRVCDAVDAAFLPRPEARLYGDYLARGYLQRLGPEEVALHKPGWGAFARTRLEAYLRAQGVATVLLAGLAFPCGPRSTLFEARQRRFGVLILEEGVTGMYPLAKLEAARLDAGLIGAASPRGGFPLRRAPRSRAAFPPAPAAARAAGERRA